MRCKFDHPYILTTVFIEMLTMRYWLVKINFKDTLENIGPHIMGPTSKHKAAEDACRYLQRLINSSVWKLPTFHCVAYISQDIIIAGAAKAWEPFNEQSYGD